MSERIESLRAVVSDDPYRPQLASPWSAKVWGRDWALATNGHAMAGVESGAPLRTDGPDAAGVLPAIWSPTHTAPLAALRAWSEGLNGVPCEPCEGVGCYECNCPICFTDHPCKECYGIGRFRVSRLMGVVLNVALLDAALLPAPAEGEAALWSDPGGLVVLRAGDWLAAVMGLAKRSKHWALAEGEFVCAEVRP